MEDFIVNGSSWMEYNCEPTGVDNYTSTKAEKKLRRLRLRLKCTMTEVINIEDNNSKWKSVIFMQSKSTIQK